MTVEVGLAVSDHDVRCPDVPTPLWEPGSLASRHPGIQAARQPGSQAARRTDKLTNIHTSRPPTDGQRQTFRRADVQTCRHRHTA